MDLSENWLSKIFKTATAVHIIANPVNPKFPSSLTLEMNQLVAWTHYKVSSHYRLINNIYFIIYYNLKKNILFIYSWWNEPGN